MAWAKPDLTVDYFSDEGKTQQKVTLFDDGKLHKQGQAFHTLDMTGKERGFAAFVVQENELFATAHVANKIHHTSLAGGKPVQCAGMIKVDNGVVVEVTNLSGHYKPNMEEFAVGLQVLHDKHMLDNASITFYKGPNDKETFTSFTTFANYVAQQKTEGTLAVQTIAPYIAPATERRKIGEAKVAIAKDELANIIVKHVSVLSTTLQQQIKDYVKNKEEGCQNKLAEMNKLTTSMATLQTDIKAESARKLLSKEQVLEFYQRLLASVQQCQLNMVKSDSKKQRALTYATTKLSGSLSKLSLMSNNPQIVLNKLLIDMEVIVNENIAKFKKGYGLG